MAKHYSPRHFLRCVPATMLQRYFSGRGIALKQDWEAYRPKDAGALFVQLKALPDWEVIQRDFRRIHLLANEAGLYYILQEAQAGDGHGDILALFDTLDGFHTKAFWTFFERPDAFQNALRFLHTSTLSRRYWRKYPDLPKGAPDFGEAAQVALAEAIGGYFREEGRGGQCKIDVYHRSGDYYCFAYPEDYSRDELVWQGGTLESHVQRPAFQVVFVFDPKVGSLDVFHHGPAKVSERLCRIFTESVLGLELDEVLHSLAVYDLNPLKERDFRFVYDRSQGIESVRICSIRLTPHPKARERIILEADNGYDSSGVYDLMDRCFSAPAPEKFGRKGRLTLESMEVARVEIKVRFQPEVQSTQSRFTLASPNGCTLAHEGMDLILRGMLKASCLEMGEETEFEELQPA